MWSQNFEKNPQIGHTFILKKRSFLKVTLHWFYTGVWFSIAFLCSDLELSTENTKKNGQNCFENVVSEY